MTKFSDKSRRKVMPGNNSLLPKHSHKKPYGPSKFKDSSNKYPVKKIAVKCYDKIIKNHNCLPKWLQISHNHQDLIFSNAQTKHVSFKQHTLPQT